MEHKFRAWDTVTKSYVEFGFDFRIDGNGSVYRRTWGETVWDRTTTLIVESFTGLSDKNGKEIYEGDIIQIIDPENPSRPAVHKSIVQWFQEGCSYEYAEIEGNKGWGLHKFRTNCIEVIGNVHEEKQ